MRKMEKIKILIVDDHTLVRDGIGAMITSFADMEVLSEASDGEEAINKAALLKPDLILMDIMLPGINGIEAARIIKERLSECKILFLSMELAEEYLNEIIKLGACGYVLKDIRKNELGDAIRKAMSGEPYFSKGISDMVFKRYYETTNPSKSNTNEEEVPVGSLTDREREIVKLLSEGVNKKDIADQLFISPRTVDAHRSNIMEKLRLKSTVELVKYAIKNNIIRI